MRYREDNSCGQKLPQRLQVISRQRPTSRQRPDDALARIIRKTSGEANDDASGLVWRTDDWLCQIDGCSIAYQRPAVAAAANKLAHCPIMRLFCLVPENISCEPKGLDKFDDKLACSKPVAATAFLAGKVMKILVLGATGLLGNALLRSMSKAPAAQVVGTIRRESSRALFSQENAQQLIVVEDLERPDRLTELLNSIRPDVVVNCIAAGRPAPADPMRSLQVYSVLPQRLAQLCLMSGCRLVQIGSDGVFSGARGAYREDDLPDADDIYGISKLLGEVNAPNAITLRTSIIGHELQFKGGLLEWFLSQQGQCRCYTRAIFSGFPTIVLADVIRDFVIPRPDLYGVYHVATRPISKFDLLLLVAERYGKSIELIPDDRSNPNRSLVADRFEKATGYVPPDWPALVDAMYRDKFSSVGRDVQG